jgi:hypothetical protein
MAGVLDRHSGRNTEQQTQQEARAGNHIHRSMLAVARTAGCAARGAQATECANG